MCALQMNSTTIRYRGESNKKLDYNKSNSRHLRSYGQRVSVLGSFIKVDELGLSEMVFIRSFDTNSVA